MVRYHRGMIWRWVIRGLAVALLTLCVAAWVGSYFEEVTLIYCSKPGAFWQTLGINRGEIVYSEIPDWRDSAAWTWRLSHGPPFDWHDAYSGTKYHGGGFAYQPIAPSSSFSIAFFPMWFLSLLSAGLLWVAWRKTRRRGTGRGFPVEVQGAKG